MNFIGVYSDITDIPFIEKSACKFNKTCRTNGFYKNKSLHADEYPIQIKTLKNNIFKCM